jgi:hypothetical protein
MIDYDSITKPVAVATAVMSAVGGGYALVDKFGWFKKDVLKWHAEHFEVSDGAAHGSFRVVVARQKIRDDCAVEDFTLEVRDANYIVHRAVPSIAKFSGPAGPNVDKLGFTMTIEGPETVAAGEAKLLARINYKCPEGNVLVNYPDHKNLTFKIETK